MGAGRASLREERHEHCTHGEHDEADEEDHGLDVDAVLVFVEDPVGLKDRGRSGTNQTSGQCRNPLDIR